MDLELDGKVALITGGSRGIGKAIALVLTREGADAALVGRDLAAAEATAASLTSMTGRTVRAYRADAGKDEDVQAVVARAVADFGRIDILVNCAAQPSGQAPVPKLEDLTDAEVLNDLNVKVLGYLRFARYVVPIMKRRNFGRIINIGGLAARQTGSIAASVRNVGVAALTKNLADELGSHGINVTCVHPGLTVTEKTPEVLRMRAAAAGVSANIIEQQIIEGTSARHFVTAEDVAEVVAFLASPKSIAVSGDAIAAGGGKPGSIYY